MDGKVKKVVERKTMSIYMFLKCFPHFLLSSYTLHKGKNSFSTYELKTQQNEGMKLQQETTMRKSIFLSAAKILVMP